jgi:minor histocompatibility antigen H13
MIDEYITYAALILMAIVPIWVGARLALRTSAPREDMSVEDALWFPVIGSAVLLGLYLLFKFFAVEYLDVLITIYFAFVSVFALHMTAHALLIPPRVLRDVPVHSFSYRIPLLMAEPETVRWTRYDIPVFAGAVAVTLVYSLSRHWIANNIIALAFSVQGISLIGLQSYKTGCVLLGGLFFYDIFWVFGTPVMLTVARSFNAPIKVLFPRDLFADTYEFSLLGLGDIVLPGIFLAMLLRYDSYRAGVNLPPPEPADADAEEEAERVEDRSAQHVEVVTDFPKPFFLFGFASYILGLVTTIAVMVYFKAGQPALLYLVPACVGSSLLLALLRGEWVQLVQFDGVPIDDSKDAASWKKSESFSSAPKKKAKAKSKAKSK